ncbi:hypothetical protein H4Q26_000435 [Puccinia striiformis f. sp. tritici PST-130]|nr:hypothetical protein H4Q26_000435 [Puccinia striiformis f. sp. tritici PST-130]
MPSLLPLPVSSSIDRLRGSSIARHRHRINSLSALLFARARTTNLAVLILSSICCLSLYLNFRSIFSSTSFRSQSDFQHSQHPFSPFQEWILEPYQARHPPSSIGAFINHIQTAVHTVSTDSSALLVYSGGQTRHQANQSTEAGSYSRLANQLGLHDQLSLGPLQTTTEDFALDSWTNLIYSVARFKEYTGDYPTQITVVGHSVKSKRFNELHRKAMRWPQERFEYIGLDPINLNRFTTTSTSFSSQETIDLKEIESSMILGEKNNPEIRGLLDWCPINGIDEYTGSLPWA